MLKIKLITWIIKKRRNRWKVYVIERKFYSLTIVLLIKTQILFMISSSFGKIGFEKRNSIFML